MEEEQKYFAQRYRHWVDIQSPDKTRVQQTWQSIARALELSQGLPPRWSPGTQT